MPSIPDQNRAVFTRCARRIALSGSALSLWLFASLFAAMGQAAPPFETYVLPRPAEDRPAAKAASPFSALSAAMGAGSGLALDRLDGLASLTLFPGANDLNLSASGMVNARAFDAQINPAQWSQSNWGGNYVQVGQGLAGLRLGGLSAPLMGGSMQGMRLYAPWSARHATLGLGLYQQADAGGQNARLAPALDAQWQIRKEWDGSAILAADASWQLSQQITLAGGQLLGIAGRNARSREQQAALMFEERLPQFTSVNGRVSALSGAHAGYAATLGLTRRLGGGYGVLDGSFSHQQNQRFRQVGIGLFVPLRRQALALRWQRMQSSGTASPGLRSTDILLGSYNAVLSPKTSVWGSSLFLREPGAAFGGSLSAGISQTLDDRWSAQAEFTQEMERGRPRLRFSIGCRLNADWQLRLLCGPAQMAGAGGQARQAFGVQIARRFRITRPHEGVIRGQVRLDDKPCRQRVGVQLDEGQYQDECAETDAQGRFAFRHVAAGSHAVRVQLATLPASVDITTPTLSVTMAQAKTADVVFQMRRVGQAQGSVRVLPDALGQIDPTAALGMIIQADPEGTAPVTASVNGENRFAFGNLALGKHVLVLDARTLPPGYEIVGPQRIEITSLAESASAESVFAIAPRRRRIEFAAE